VRPLIETSTVYCGLVAHTHELTFAGDHVVKRYVDYARGEHLREWTVLQAISDHLPNLVPRPLGADLSATPPWITMSRLPGSPLDGRVTDDLQDALHAALTRLWSVPTDDLPPRRFHPDEARTVIAARLTAGQRPAGLTGAAYDLCLTHLAQKQPVAGATILGHADSNLANYLWDGQCVRVVDFEDAGVSTIEYELGFMVEHLSARDTDWSRFLQRFTVDSAQLCAARLTAAALWLQLLLPGGPAAARNPPGTLDQQAHRILALAG
jgi:aminoglycoside phosphotransferase (APT) family kinase protein